MHADEITIDKDLVHQLIAQQFPQWAHLAITPINAVGTDNAIFRLGTDMAIRLPRIVSAAPKIEKEYEWLPQLAAHLSLAIPTPLAFGLPIEIYQHPWIVYRWLDGHNGTHTSINLDHAAISLGRFIGELHTLDTTHALQSSRGYPLPELDNEV